MNRSLEILRRSTFVSVNVLMVGLTCHAIGRAFMALRPGTRQELTSCMSRVVMLGDNRFFQYAPRSLRRKSCGAGLAALSDPFRRGAFKS
jgi:hypothetical protein